VSYISQLNRVKQLTTTISFPSSGLAFGEFKEVSVVEKEAKDVCTVLLSVDTDLSSCLFCTQKLTGADKKKKSEADGSGSTAAAADELPKEENWKKDKPAKRKKVS
jgi:hypothetical protein